MECHVVLFDTYSPNYRELDKSRHDKNYFSHRDENCPILCCDENSNSRRDEIYPILYNLENMYQITPRGTPMNLSLLLNQLECTI